MNLVDKLKDVCVAKMDRIMEAYDAGVEKGQILERRDNKNPRLREIDQKAQSYDIIEVMAYDQGFKSRFK